MRGRLRKITAFICVGILCLSFLPRSADTEQVYSEWFGLNGALEEKEGTAEKVYTFGEQKTVRLTDLMIQLHIRPDPLATLRISVSDPEAVSVSEENGFLTRNWLITAEKPFDRVSLEIRSFWTTTEIILRNPAPSIPAGQTVDGEAGVFAAWTEVPEGTKLRVTDYVPTEEQRIRAAELAGEDAYITWLDISLAAGEEKVETAAAVTLRTDLPLPEAPEMKGRPGRTVLRGVRLFHVLEDGTLEELETEAETEGNAIRLLSFAAESFSGFAVSYTVDFLWDGFEYAIPGGSAVSVRELMPVLGIAGEGNGSAPAEEIESVTFSDPSLVGVRKVEENTTAGALKEGYEIEYSAELTEEDILAMDAREIYAPDWALISLRPFLSEETLTIRLKGGRVFEIAVTDAQIRKRYISASGEAYDITVTYGEDAGIPDGAELDVREILPDGAAEEGNGEYDAYAAMCGETLGVDAADIRYARFFDIRILAEGETVQPAEGSRVEVRVELADAESGNLSVVHFGDEPEVLTAVTKGDTVTFAASGFSVYAIVDAPEPVYFGIRAVESTDELTENEGFYLSYQGTSTYVSSRLNGDGCFVEVNDYTSAAVWYFEPADGGYYLYTYVDGERQYLKNTSGNLVGLDPASGTKLTVSRAAQEKFYIKHASENKWLQHSGSGKGIRFWTDKNNATNSQFTITYASSYGPDPEDDPYGLDGKTFGIAYNDESVTAVGLSSSALGGNKLAGTDMLIRPDVLERTGILLVSENTDLTEWSFEKIRQDKYYITTEIEGQKKYLTVSGASVTLTDEPDPAGHSVITAKPGTGANSGKWHFTCGGYSLNSAGTAAKGFNGATGSGATTWLNLVEKSFLQEDDFTLYNAKKVSVSDRANVYDGQQVVLYTRIWNETTERYDFYVVDHDGVLVRCYDNGDGIEWIGSQVNTAVWNFTEYYENGSPTYFYELQNAQYGKYIAPRISDGQILSGSPAGINLNGRRFGENNTTVVAWDESGYSYAGLKTENGRVKACPLPEAEEFHFAVIRPADAQDELTTVATLDNRQYGITMKMVDFNNAISSDRDSVQTAFFGQRDNNAAGLLSTNLGENGYPTTTSLTGSEKPLSDLFTGMTTVNHLFIQSIHNESGYFEYDSTSNFAHLESSGNFTVYDQLAAIGTASGPTRTHGQFMPYNTIEPGRYADVTNQTSVLQAELSDLNPRKGEKLYLIPQKEADYFFGMELSAGFTQTPNGRDAWGNDIIFEFSGDDDFWLYVDGELVLDLGGVHSAMTGSVNFRTGVVKGRGGATSTLYEIFRNNYRARGLSEAQISEKLDEQFTRNGDGQYVFRNYSNHDMKIFYMERGAGASNLRMRFNLAAVKPGSFLLSKKLSGTEEADNALIEFPYQIRYKTEQDEGETWHLLENRLANGRDSVVYRESGVPVPYRESYIPAGGTEAYENVFFLKPGESAEVRLPEDATVYTVTECGVNPDLYDRVSVNGTELMGETTGNLVHGTARKDYTTPEDSLENRAETEFDNHVQEGAMRTLRITKKLFDVDGTTPLHYPDSETEFTFRLYLGNEDADPSNLPYANMYSYCVKDADGYYCRWNEAEQKFESIGKTDFGTLTPEDKDTAVFTTSMYGSISRIPADHTVEVRNLVLGTQYMVEERSGEVPRGYTLRSGDGYTRTDVSPEETSGDAPYAGTVFKDEHPEIEVRNQKGWGLTVKKVWSDRDFMESHDDIYFAVYIGTGSGKDGLSLYEGSVRRLAAPDSEIYLFFDDLKYGGQPYYFSDFVIREVQLTGDFTVDGNGKVSGYDSVVPVAEGGALTVGGTAAGGGRDEFAYTVHYDVGESTGHNENVRLDTVTDSRPGIAMYKTDPQGNMLAGAVFTLKNGDGSDVAAASYTSGSDGLITVAYLPEGTYILTETAAPRGWSAPEGPIVITVDRNGHVTASGPSQTVTEDETHRMQAVISIVNRPVSFTVRKIGADTERPQENVHFALYRQVTDQHGNKRKDYLPISGYEDLITDENGVLPRISMELDPGTYYLTEKQAPDGYRKMEEDLCFTIGTDGTVSVDTEAYRSWLTESTGPDGTVSREITVRDKPDKLEIIISGKKEIHGRELLESDRFTFILAPAHGDPAAYPGLTGTPPRARAVNDAEGNFSFELYLSKAEIDSVSTQYPVTLTYLLTEENAGELIDQILYSEQKYWIQIVLRNENGKIVQDGETRIFTQDPWIRVRKEIPGEYQNWRRSQRKPLPGTFTASPAQGFPS